jgi:hypothetical protein
MTGGCAKMKKVTPRFNAIAKRRFKFEHAAEVKKSLFTADITPFTDQIVSFHSTPAKLWSLLCGSPPRKPIFVEAIRFRTRIASRIPIDIKLPLKVHPKAA